jgi:hypothetical protein
MEKLFYVTFFTLFFSLFDDILYLDPAVGCARSRFYRTVWRSQCYNKTYRKSLAWGNMWHISYYHEQMKFGLYCVVLVSNPKSKIYESILFDFSNSIVIQDRQIWSRLKINLKIQPT